MIDRKVIIGAILGIAIVLAIFMLNLSKPNLATIEKKVGYNLINNDDSVVSAITSSYIKDGNLIIHISNPNNEKIQVIGLEGSKKYKIKNDEVIIYNYKGEQFKLKIGSHSDIYEFGTWIIEGDKVYVNNSWGRLEAYPHTIYCSGWVYFNVTPYQDFGELDFLWGFNTTEVKPTKAEFYKPHFVNWTTNHSAFFYNVSSISLTNESCDYGNEYNSYKRKITYQVCSQWNETTGECESYNTTSAVVCFDSYEQNGTNYTAFWHTDHSRIENWINVGKYLNHKEYDYKGMNRWWFVTNFKVEPNKTYTARAYVKVPVTIEGTSGKYYFAIKRSAETLSEAVTSGHFMVLDPWWNASWSRKQAIHINNTGNSNALTDYQVMLNITYDSDMNNDFSDIRVVNETSGETVPYWNESAVQGSWNKIWFNVSYIPANSWCNDTYYLYYGNPSASSASDGNATFEFFDGFDRADSADVGNGWTEDDDIGSIESNQLKILPPDEASYWESGVWKAHNLASGKHMFKVSGKFTDLLAGDSAEWVYWHIFGTQTDRRFGFAVGNGNNIYYLNNNGWVDSTYDNTPGTRYEFEIMYDADANTADYYLDGTLLASGQLPHTTTITDKITFGCYRTANETQYFDNVFVRKYTFSEPSAELSYDNVPTLVSNWNNKTNNSDLSFVLNLSESVEFRVSYNLSGNITWKKDGVIVQTNTSTTSANFTTSFNFSCDRTVSVMSTNENGSSSETIWTITVPFATPSDYIWTPTQDWNVKNRVNLTIDVNPPKKYGQVISRRDKSQRVVHPNAFKVGDKIWVYASIYDDIGGTYWIIGGFNSTDGKTFGEMIIVNGTKMNITDNYGDGAVWISYYNGSFIYPYARIDGSKKMSIISGTSTTDFHEIEYTTDNAPWNPCPDVYNPVLLYQLIPNSSGWFIFGQKDPDGTSDPNQRRIGYNYFNSTDLNDTSGVWSYEWHATSGGWHDLINDGDNIAGTREYHSIAIFQLPNEKGYVGAMSILDHPSAPQGTFTELWRLSSMDYFTEQSVLGWKRVGTLDRNNITPLISKGSSYDSNMAEPGKGVVTMKNGTKWYYYYNSARGTTSTDQFTNVSLVISDAHTWTKAYINNSCESASFTSNISKDPNKVWDKLYANYKIGSNISFSILYPENDSIILSNLDTGADISSIPSSLNMVKVKIVMRNTSISPEIYNWYLTTKDSYGVTDTSFTVTLPAGYTYAHFNLTGVANPSTQTNYPPEGQSDSQPFYNISNTGNVNLTVKMKINATIPNVILKADTDNNPSGAKEINTTYATLCEDLPPNNYLNVWLWTDLSHAEEQETGKELEINVSQAT